MKNIQLSLGEEKTQYVEPIATTRGYKVEISLRKKGTWARDHFYYPFGELKHRTDDTNKFFRKNRRELYKMRALRKCLLQLGNNELPLAGTS